MNRGVNMKPRNLYLMEVALAVTAALALVLLSNQHGALRTGVATPWPWAR
jgi:hypothetical protein